MKRERKPKSNRPKGVVAAKRMRGMAPRWIRYNQVHLAIAYLSNDEGVVVATVDQIAEAARMSLNALGDAFNHLESRRELHILGDWSWTDPITVVIADTPLGEKVGDYIDDVAAKKYGIPRHSPGPADFPPPIPLPAIK